MKKTLITIIAFTFLLIQSASAQNNVPKPEQPRPSGINVSGVVNVQIAIDEQGDVSSASAVSGHPLLRPFAEKAALKAKFRQTTFSGNPVKVNCSLVYNFVPAELIQSKDDKVITKGVINGSAILLPKPEYTKQAQDSCASGQVQVEVLVSGDGNVISAKAVLGDELLRDSAVKAAMKAKFASSGHILLVKEGIIVYNFVPKTKCVQVGIVNERAKYLAKPIYPKSCRCQGVIKVRIVVDMSGNVISASTDSGNPLLRNSAVEAARKTKFSPLLIVGTSVLTIAFLEYKFFPNGKVST